MRDTGTHAGSRAGVSFSRSLTGLLAALNGDTRQDGPVRQAEGTHRLSAPLGTDVAAGDSWICAGRVYDVVWAPAPTAHDVDQLIGLKEVR